MAVRFKTTFKNALNELYTIHIHDADFAGAETLYVASGEGFELTQDGDGDNLYSPIIYTSAMIFMHVQDVNRTEIEDFIADIVDSQDENRFTVVIYDGNGQVFFRGKVQFERILIPDRHFNQITINASDGFGRLRSIPYSDNGTLYEGWETVRGHLFNVLSKLNLFGYGNNTTNSTAYANKITYDNVTSNTFNELRFQHDAMKEIKTDGTVLPFSCHDVLTQILTRFGCRIVQMAGVFHIQELTALAEAGPMDVYFYDKDGDFDSVYPYSYNTAIIQKLAGGQAWFREPAKSVRLDYEYRDAVGGSNLSQEIIPWKTWKNIGMVPAGNGERVAFNFDFSVEHQAGGTATMYYITYEFAIRTGTYWLSNAGGVVQWINGDNTARYKVTNMFEIDDGIAINLIHEVSFIIPELPFTGDLNVYWDWAKTRSNGAAPITPPTGIDTITNLQNVIVLLYSTTEFDINEGTIVTMATGSTTSGEQVELGTVVIGDLPFLRSIGRIQRYVALGQWENTSLKWGHGGPELLSLTHMVTREILSLRRKNTKIIAYVIRSPYAGAANKILGNVVTRASYRANSGIWDIETFVPVIDRGGIAWSDYVETDQIGGGAPGGITLPNPPAGTFISLTDTPVSYSGQAGKIPQVNSGETGLEWGSGGEWNREQSGFAGYDKLTPKNNSDVIDITVDNEDNYSPCVNVFNINGNGPAISARTNGGPPCLVVLADNTYAIFADSNHKEYSAIHARTINKSGDPRNEMMYPIQVNTYFQGGSLAGAGCGILFDISPGIVIGSRAEFSLVITDATINKTVNDFIWKLSNKSLRAEVMRLTGAGVLNVKSGFSVDGTPAVADGTYTVGIGSTQNGTITTKGGIITAIQEAIGALLNPLPDLADGNTLAYFDRTEAEGVLKDATNQDKIYWDLFAGSAGRGAEQATGNIVLYGVYEITATQADFFYTGCAVGDIFPCAVVKTCDANNKVKRVLGNHLVSLGDTTRPLNGIFDGVNDYMKTAVFTRNQPNTVYILFRQIRLEQGREIFDGNSNYTGHIEQDKNTNGLKAYAGAFSPLDTSLPMNRFGVIRVLFNGVNSVFQIDDTVITTPLGSTNQSGFTVGSAGGLTAFANMEFVAAIIRKGVDSDTYKDDLLRWFKNKRNSINNTHLINNLPILNYRYHILAQKGDKIFASNLVNKLFYSENNGSTFTEIAFANANKTQMGYIFANGNLLVTTSTEVYKSTDKLLSLVAVTPKNEAGATYTPSRTDEFLPLNRVQAQITATGDELIVFGTYGGQALVWSSLNGNDMKIIYRFSAVSDYNALHIHDCAYDPAAKEWYICTGDNVATDQIHWIKAVYNEIAATWGFTYLTAGAENNQLKSVGVNVFENKLWWGSDQTVGHDKQGIWSCAFSDIADTSKHTRVVNLDQEIISVLVETNRIIFTAIEWNTANLKWNLYVYNRSTGVTTQKKFDIIYNPPSTEANKYTRWLSHISKVREGEYNMEVFSQLLFRTIKFYV